MPTPLHSNQTVTDGIHVIKRWEYVDNTARDAASYGTADNGGIAEVGAGAPFTYYLLTDSTGPTWATVGSAGVTPPIWDFNNPAESTSGAAYVTMCSIVIPAETNTFLLHSHSLVSMSNTTANGTIRLQNITDAVTLGARDWESEMQDAANILSGAIAHEFIHTAAAGAKTIELQYALASGVGTVTISNALLKADRTS